MATERDENKKFTVELVTTEEQDATWQAVGWDKWGLFGLLVAALLFVVSVAGTTAGALTLMLVGHELASWGVGILVAIAVLVSIVKFGFEGPSKHGR